MGRMFKISAHNKYQAIGMHSVCTILIVSFPYSRVGQVRIDILSKTKTAFNLLISNIYRGNNYYAFLVCFSFFFFFLISQFYYIFTTKVNPTWNKNNDCNFPS